MTAAEAVKHINISTHSLLAEGDPIPARRFGEKAPISTHSLLAEGDASVAATAVASADFNPLPPRGGRQ